MALEWEDIDESSTIAELCRTFDLSPFERDILLLCAAVELDPMLGDICAKLQGDQDLNYPTLALALNYFPRASVTVLSQNCPLQYWRLLEYGKGLTITQAPLRIDQQILSFLLGMGNFDQKLQGIVQKLPAHRTQVPLAHSQIEIAEEIVEMWLKMAEVTPIIQLCGGDSTTRIAIAYTVAQEMGYSLRGMSAASLEDAPLEMPEIRQRWQREALLNDRLLLLDAEEVSPQDKKLGNRVYQFVDYLHTPVIVTSRERLAKLPQEVLTFEIPRLTYYEQTKIWELALGREGYEEEIRMLASNFNLSRATIQAACTRLEGEKEGLNHAGQLWDFCRKQARPQLEGLAERIESTASWEDLVLPEEQRSQLKEIANHLKYRSKVYYDWGFAGKSNRGLGITAVFHGESGTGKTLAAEVLANEFGLDLYRIDLSAVVSKWIGETEKNLSKIFDAAEGGGVVLLFDEADALFAKRTDVKDSLDRFANGKVSYLLQRMEAYQGLAILTTNLMNAIDGAFMRRIRFHVAFPFPDEESRVRIWQGIFPQGVPVEGLDNQRLGKLKVAGGNIRQIAMNAAFLAAEGGAGVGMRGVWYGAQREYEKSKRLWTEEEVGLIGGRGGSAVAETRQKDGRSKEKRRV